jgi:hypothetical protein
VINLLVAQPNIKLFFITYYRIEQKNKEIFSAALFDTEAKKQYVSAE